MENEEFPALKKVLRRYGPAPLPEGLRQRLEDAANGPISLADRVLAIWTTVGAVAAGAVIVLTVWQLAAGPRWVPPSAQDMALHQQTVMEYEKIIAAR